MLVTRVLMRLSCVPGLENNARAPASADLALPLSIRPLRRFCGPASGPGGRKNSSSTGGGVGALRDRLRGRGRRLTGGGPGPAGNQDPRSGGLDSSATPGGTGSQRRCVLGLPGTGRPCRTTSGSQVPEHRRAAGGREVEPSSSGADGLSGAARVLDLRVRAPVADGLDERHGLDPAQPDRCRGTAPHHLHPDDRGPVPSGATGRRRSGRRRAAVGGTDAAVGHVRKCRHDLSGPQGHLAPHDRGLHRLLRAHAAGGRLLLRRGQGRGLLPVHHPAHPGAAGGACQRRAGAAEQAWHRGGGGGSGGVRTHAQQRPAGGSGDPG